MIDCFSAILNRIKTIIKVLLFRMELTNSNIEKSIDDIFNHSRSHLGKDILNAFIPLGGFKELSNNNTITFAFEDELRELVEFLHQYSSLVDSAIDEKGKARFYLHMYCRIMENDYQYLVIYNLLRLLNNLEPDWSFKTIKNGEVFYCENPTPKIDEIAKLCKAHNFKVGKILKNIWKNDLRNAFYHSQYYLFPNGSFVNTRSYSSTSTHKPSKIVYKLSDIEYFYKKVEYFFDYFFKVFFTQLKSFRNGEKYILKNNHIVLWDIKNQKWIFTSNA